MKRSRAGNDAMKEKQHSDDLKQLLDKIEPISNEMGEMATAQVTGKIKWFDISKGYGFITPDIDGISDILLHVNVLREGGFQTALEGALVQCTVKQGERGLQCVAIISIDMTTAVHPAELPQRTREIVIPTSGLERAIVKWFNRNKGFGFLSRGEGTEDIFIHMETLRRYGLAELRPGQVVLVRFGNGSHGLMAVEIHPDNPVTFQTH